MLFQSVRATLRLPLQRRAQSGPLRLPRKRRRHGYRLDEPLTSVIEKEAANLNWTEADVRASKQTLERLTTQSFSATTRSSSATNFHGNELRMPFAHFTVEMFITNLDPEARVKLGLRPEILIRLLQLFVPQSEWQFEMSPEEQHRQRLLMWQRFTPNTPSSRYHMDDFKEIFPEKDFEMIKELANNPPKEAWPNNWPLDVTGTRHA
ncbi:hypothetical protein DIPPA_11553 [Diplonema papillatum]|nr:hypothetical protein DIPPA_11553 [Diplonema papillatum]